MAVAHIVWVKFHDDIRPARIEEHVAKLMALKDRIPGIREVSVGENFTDRAAGYTHGLSVLLEDRAALTAYAKHPYHVAVAKALSEDADYLVMDYEF